MYGVSAVHWYRAFVVPWSILPATGWVELRYWFVAGWSCASYWLVAGWSCSGGASSTDRVELQRRSQQHWVGRLLRSGQAGARPADPCVS